jgi:hypothetical protein
MKKWFAIAVVLIAMRWVPCEGANEWDVVGAGNATCTNWQRMNPSQRQEVLSWMAGFSSATSLELAAAGQPEYRLEFLTYEYLARFTDKHCSNADKGSGSMLNVLMEILKQLPRR